MTRKNTAKRPLSFKFWKQVGESYYANREGLYQAIEGSGRSEGELKRRMGSNHTHIQDLLLGKGVDYYLASFVDWGLTPDGRN